MRGRSYTPSPPRGYGRRGRSRSPRGRYGGGRGRDLPTSLLVRNLRHDCRPEDLRRPFEQFGALKDIYLPRDYYTGEPRGFGFIQYVDPADASEAKHHMDGYVLLGRELTVVFAEENRKKPADMRARERGRGRFRDRRRSPPRRGRSRSRSHDYYSSPPKRRSISPRDERYSRERSYSRSPAYNGPRVHGQSPGRGPSLSRSRSRSPRNRSQSPRNRSQSPRRSIGGSPRRSRSRSQSPNHEEYRRERNGDLSPSQ